MDSKSGLAPRLTNEIVRICVDGDQVGAEDCAQTLAERERIAPSLAAVHADDDGAEHDVLLSWKGL